MSEFKCETCGKILNDERALSQHVNDAHVNKPEPQPESKNEIQSNSDIREVPKPSTGPKFNFNFGKKHLLALLGLFVVVGGVGVYSVFGIPEDNSVSGAAVLSQPIGSVGSAHIHADVGLFLEGEEFTPFDERYYMQMARVNLAEAGEGSVIHMNAENVPLKFFFNTLRMNFDNNCFTLDNGKKYCNDEENSLKMFVRHLDGEWEENRQFHTYIFEDGDQILITYGDETREEIEEQQDSVTSKAIGVHSSSE